MKTSWIGIDYGSKLAGTTCVAWLNDENVLTVEQSEKKKDADEFVKKIVNKIQPHEIFLDAPLSLPGVYNGDGDDYFYREADRSTKAMSPMFIGGLTARAMKLKSELGHIRFYESYPGGLAKVFKLQNQDYKKGPRPGSEFRTEVSKQIEYPISESFWSNWHRVDALLAWQIGFRMNNGHAEKYGNENEGLIYI